MSKSPNSSSIPEIASIYSPFPNQEQAERVAETLLNEKRIACANIVQGVTSLYFWGGQIQKDNEVIVFFKTSLSHVKETIQRIEELHPYEVPAVIQLEAQANSSYAQWVKDCVAEQGGQR